MAKARKGGRKSARTIGGVAPKPGKRNTSGAPSTGGSIGSFAVQNNMTGKQGGKGGLPKSTTPSPGRWGSH